MWDSSIKIGHYKIKNRIVFPPMTCNWANNDGSATDKLIKFYQQNSEGGCGMVVVEGTAVSPEGKATSNCLCAYDKSHLEGLKKIAGIIKGNDCFAGIQLSHAGGQANPNFTGFEPVSPSGIKCMATGFGSRELSINEIRGIKNKFVRSAGLASKAGFDAIEIHLAHGYLLHEFLSEHTNKRNDQYGGSLENRARLILEIIGGIKEDKPDLIIGVRISGEDYLKDGINYKINERVIPLLEKNGVEYFSVSAGIYETSKFKHEAMKKGEFFEYAKRIKEITNKPVIGVGKILDLDIAEKHLKNKDCDLVAIGRGLLADPYIIKKVKNNLKFNRCKECDQCSYLRFGKFSVDCPVRRSNGPKKILILGGARFHGLQLAESLLEKGEEVYVLNRGRFKKRYKKGINHLIADRNDTQQLQNVLMDKEFDVVFDNNGYNQSQVRTILEVIKNKCGHYIFTSSIAVYLKTASNRGLREEEANGVQEGFYSPDVRGYALDKFEAENYIKQLKGVNYTILRFPNILGEGDFAKKLTYYYNKLKNNEVVFLEEEVERFNLIYVKDVVKIFGVVMENRKCYGKIINISEPVAYSYEEFFKEIFEDLYSKKKISLIPAQKVWEMGKFTRYPWGPLLDSSLSKKILGNIKYTPLHVWGKKALRWELKDNKYDKAKQNVKNIIIKTSYSKIPDGKLKSNFGDLLRSTVILSCIGKDYVWVTDQRSRGLLQYFVEPEKIISSERDLDKYDLSEDLNVYNLNDYTFNEKISNKIKGLWHGFIKKGNSVVPENNKIKSIKSYFKSNMAISWQQALVEGLGFIWKQQDYAMPRVVLKNVGDIDVGLNWHVHPNWKSKRWPTKNWKELERMLQKKYTVSYQQGLDNFDEYLNWISSCRVVVTCDTLGLHLASALRKRVVAITGPTENREFSYKRVSFIKPLPRKCMPCDSPKCKKEKKCLEEIDAKRVGWIVMHINKPILKFESQVPVIKK